jgi:ferredoxin
MAIIITDECINCDACISECPNNAIYEPDQEWAYSEGTELNGITNAPNGDEVDAEAMNEPVSDEFYFIVPGKCTECKGFHDEPQCASVCPVDCCVPDENHVETETALLQKKAWLYAE